LNLVSRYLTPNSTWYWSMNSYFFSLFPSRRMLSPFLKNHFSFWLQQVLFWDVELLSLTQFGIVIVDLFCTLHGVFLTSISIYHCLNCILLLDFKLSCHLLDEIALSCLVVPLDIFCLTCITPFRSLNYIIKLAKGVTIPVYQNSFEKAIKHADRIEYEVFLNYIDKVTSECTRLANELERE